MDKGQEQFNQPVGWDRGFKKERIMPMQLKNIAYKLQKALCCKGRYIRINNIQVFSTEKQKMITKYVLKENRYVEGLEKEKDITLLETYKIIDIVNYLAEQLNGGE